MSLVMMSLVILTGIAGIMYYVVSAFERRLVPWRRH
jgi:ABC-type nitrate/sulfonate/bicarbonate transport system permease component